MNQAIKGGNNDILMLQKLFVNSDIYYDPQALILAPTNIIEISKAIVSGKNYIDATKRGCLKGLEIIENSIANGSLMHDEKEDSWIEMLKNDITSIPENESEFVETTMPILDTSKLILKEYGL
jgi:hypothetical protein